MIIFNHHGRFLTMRGVLVTVGGFWDIGEGDTHHGSFLTIRGVLLTSGGLLITSTVGRFQDMGGDGGVTHHGRFLTMMAGLSWVSFSLLIASTVGRFLGWGWSVTHHGRFLGHEGVLLTTGGSWPWGGITHHGRFLTMMAGLSWVSFSLLIESTVGKFLEQGGGRYYSAWEVSDQEGCYSPREVSDHDGWTELGFLQFADRLHCVSERRLRPTVIYNTEHRQLTGVCGSVSRDGSSNNFRATYFRYLAWFVVCFLRTEIRLQ